MHRCFNTLEIFPGLNSQVGSERKLFQFAGDRQLSRKIQTGFQIGKPQKMKSGKEFDKYGPS